MTTCPHIEKLRRLEAGECSDADADSMLAHLDQCATCGEVLERIRGEDLDSRILRRAVREDEASRSGPSSGAPGGQDPAEWDIPDYTRLRLCGEGAFGTVWAVRDRVGVCRALKVINLDRLGASNLQCRESTALEVYCRHVEAHPNLIAVFHVGVHGQLLYYTMELADDAVAMKPVRSDFPEAYRPLTLQHVISEGPISPDTAIEVALRLLRGLARLHLVGMAHRDIKPANIVFVNRQPKLGDIGMITSDTATPSNVGTPDYMPPDGQMDLTADTYAMGRVLYEMMIGGARPDFPRLPAHVHGASQHWDMDRVQGLLDTASSPSAQERFQNAGQMAEALEGCRLWSYDSLFDELQSPPIARLRGPRNPYTSLGIAAINALPWVLGLILAIVLVAKFL